MKWYISVIVGIICALILYYGLIPVFVWLFASSQDSSILKDALNKMVPNDYTIEDVISDDLFITSWDLNNRSPRFFSKWAYNNLKEPDFYHHLSLLDMTWASANTPYYFKPASINNGNSSTEYNQDIYISGDNIAVSPALLSYLYANERKSVKQEDIRVVSIGATNEEA